MESPVLQVLLDLKALREPMAIMESEENLGRLELMELLDCEVFRAQLVLQV